MKSLNKTETPIFLSVVCSLFPKAIFLTFSLTLVFSDSKENLLVANFKTSEIYW